MHPISFRLDILPAVNQYHADHPDLPYSECVYRVLQHLTEKAGEE